MKFLDVPSSGSIADRTHSHNRAGQYTRNRRSPVQPIGTGRRAFIRSAFGASSSAWASLTNLQQEAWISFAADHPVTDSLGSAIILTGHQMYVSCATQFQNVGEAPPSDPPSDLSLPDISGGGGTFSVATGFEFTPIDGVTGQFVTFAFSKPMGTGRRFTNTFWQPHDTDGWIDASNDTYNLATAVYAAEFGTLVAGKVVFVKVTPIGENGWTGTPTILRVVTSA